MGLLDFLSRLLGGESAGERDDRPRAAAGGPNGERDGETVLDTAETAADHLETTNRAGEGADRDAPDPDPTLPAVDLDPGTDPETAHERVVKAFEEAGYHVTPGNLMNSVSGPLDGIGKLFNFQTDGEIHTAVVYPGEWDETATNAVLTLASNLRTGTDLDGLHVIAAREPPDVVTYLTGAHPRRTFALEAIVELQNGPEFASESAPHYADVGRDLLEKHFDLRIDVEDPESLARLDEVVLSQLRTVGDDRRSQEGYVPREALIAVGTLAGEVMRRTLERNQPVRTDWSAGEDISSTGVVLTIGRADDEEEFDVNPVGKAFKLFESGAEDSLVFLYRTSRRVVRDELS